ncbi:MAG TPA: multidrug efflux SMR transporter [Leucothrix mucor]|uniref:Multidrug efflux SMR transporter n=1 Tax=Leucothrix mucor TaxID=45248 RepID=A0A7V2WVC9_LEUMU|nr:multidrug efflux SMR transporter [Leucothrix mucor]
MGYFYLAIAIIMEAIAMTALKAGGFSKILPTLIMATGYGVSFYFMLLALKTIPMGITYAIWAGVGIVLIAVIGMLRYDETPDIAAMIGMGLIVLGVIVIRIFSHSGVH